MLVGIFVGGKARRMGGIAKGLLPARDGQGPLVFRAAEIARGLGLTVALVGRRLEYASLDLPTIDDAAFDRGPLGGLVALLEHVGEGSAIALAGDLPFVTPQLLERIARTPSAAAILAPRRGTIWEPLIARYDARNVAALARARLEAGDLSLQRLLDVAGAEALVLDEAEERMLEDWDTPADVAATSKETLER